MWKPNVTYNITLEEYPEYMKLIAQVRCQSMVNPTFDSAGKPNGYTVRYELTR